MKDKSCILAMLQPPPLPGTYLHNGESFESICKKVLDEAELIFSLDYDGVILQNMHDGPIKQQSDISTIAFMSTIATLVKQKYPNKILGILVNWDGVASLAVAMASNADFVRVEYLYTGVSVGMNGFVEGQCGEILAFKKRLMTNIPVYADIQEANGNFLAPISKERDAVRTVKRAFADGIFVSSPTVEESIDLYHKIRESLPDTKIFIGGRATGDNIESLMKYYDGVSVSTWIKDGDMRNPINVEKAKLFVKNARRGWESR